MSGTDIEIVFFGLVPSSTGSGLGRRMMAAALEVAWSIGDRVWLHTCNFDHPEPTVLRRIEVPLAIRLDRLHLTIQAAMGWTNSHLYEIRARDVGWGVPDPDWGDGPLDASKAKLVDVLEDVGVKTLRYLYDFGDG